MRWFYRKGKKAEEKKLSGWSVGLHQNRQAERGKRSHKSSHFSFCYAITELWTYFWSWEQSFTFANASKEQKVQNRSSSEDWKCTILKRDDISSIKSDKWRSGWTEMSVPRSENDKNLLFQLKTRFHWQNKEDSDQGFRPQMQTGDWCRQVTSQPATVTTKPLLPREADARRHLILHTLHAK